MTKLTSQELHDSFFYPACGKDFRPVKRFSDMVSTFIYTDWNTAEDQVVAEIKTQFSAESGSRLLLCDHRDAWDDFQTVQTRTVRTNPRRPTDKWMEVEPKGPFVPTHLFPPGFDLTQQECDKYLGRTETAVGVKSPWAHEFIFRRIDKGRDIRLVYFSEEALARYALLFGAAGVAPQFLYTMQSGPGWGHGWTFLEQQDATLERFLLSWPVKPDVWIRGDWNEPGEAGGFWNTPIRQLTGRLRKTARAFGRIQPEAVIVESSEDTR